MPAFVPFIVEGGQRVRRKVEQSQSQSGSTLTEKGASQFAA
jgi:hypothetical protein